MFEWPVPQPCGTQIPRKGELSARPMHLARLLGMLLHPADEMNTSPTLLRK